MNDDTIDEFEDIKRLLIAQTMLLSGILAGVTDPKNEKHAELARVSIDQAREIVADVAGVTELYEGRVKH